MKSVELIIRGRKVVDVGYRPFLLLNALRRGIQKIYAYNFGAEGEEAVIVQVQGEDDVITSYVDFIRSKYPEHAEVEEIVERDFQGQVEDAFKFAQILQFEQIAKAVPVIISLDKKQDIIIEKQDIMIGMQETSISILREVKEDTSAMKDDISVLRKDASDSLYEKFEEMRREIAEIKATLSEIKAKAA